MNKGKNDDFDDNLKDILTPEDKENPQLSGESPKKARQQKYVPLENRSYLNPDKKIPLWIEIMIRIIAAFLVVVFLGLFVLNIIKI